MRIEHDESNENRIVGQSFSWALQRIVRSPKRTLYGPHADAFVLRIVNRAKRARSTSSAASQARPLHRSAVTFSTSGRKPPRAPIRSAYRTYGGRIIHRAPLSQMPDARLLAHRRLGRRIDVARANRDGIIPGRPAVVAVERDLDENRAGLGEFEILQLRHSASVGRLPTA